MGQPFSSLSSSNINSESNFNNRSIDTGNLSPEDGTITPPLLATAASIAAHERLVEELNRVAFERNQRVHLDSYSSSNSEGEDFDQNSESSFSNILIPEQNTSLSLFNQVRRLLTVGEITINMISDNELESTPSSSLSSSTTSLCKSKAKQYILSLPSNDEPESLQSYNEFRMDVLIRSGLIEKERKLLSKKDSILDNKEIIKHDCVKEEQLFQPSSSSLRKVIKNLKLGYDSYDYDDGENEFHESNHNPNGVYSEASLIEPRNRMTPNRRKIVDHIYSKTFCVGYIGNGTGIFTASQDNRIRIYKQKFMRKRYVRDKIIPVPFVGWSILDVDVSPDGRHIAYSTWNNALYQYDLEQDNSWIELPLENQEARFGVFSLKFNQDGSEIVAGSTNGLFVYSREIDKCILQVQAHEDDVNAVCFADDSSNLILSSGDDGLIKMWDRRTMGGYGDGLPVRIFAGHRDGVTFIDSRKDNRYFLTNSKDQTVKVWDMRIGSRTEGIDATRKSVKNQIWDYRWQYTPVTIFKTQNLPGDASILTLRGHSVLHTLVRAKFSPDHTGKRFIYAGCARGGCVVYDLYTGDVHKKFGGHKSVVRDCIWHPYENEFTTTSWDGYTYVWRYDRRGPHTKDLDANSQALQDWDSTDEFDEPIVRYPNDIRKRKRVTNSDNSVLRRPQDAGSRARMQVKIAESSTNESDDESLPSNQTRRRL